MNILVTDADYKHSLGIVRCLGKMGYRSFVLSYRKGSLCFWSKYSKKEIIIKRNYTLNELLEVVKQYKINLIIPVGASSFDKIVPYKKELLQFNVHCISVDYEILKDAFSKEQMVNLANKIDVPTPQTFFLSHISELTEIIKKTTYPCVIKSKDENNKIEVLYAYNENELKTKYLLSCTKYKLTHAYELPMIQEYIGGEGCAFFAVYNKGICGLTFQHKRVREFPISGGPSVCAESYKNAKLEEYGKKILDNLIWHGIAMVEFKLRNDGTPVLMELNPKFWGSLDLALEAGVNFPKALIDIYNGEKVSYDDKYKFPFRYHWPLNGEFKYALYRPSAIFTILKDFLNPKVKSNLWIIDLLPNIYMFLSPLKFLIKKLK